MPSSPFTARTVRSISDVAASVWDACANPSGLTCERSGGERFNPFVCHAFLLRARTVEIGRRTQRLDAGACAGRGAAGRIVACAPAYVKSHSMGEYVFDHAWAQAYERAGRRYYPKLQVAAPFTPVTGRRLLVARDAPAGAREGADRRARAACARRSRLPRAMSLSRMRPTPRRSRRRASPAAPASSSTSSTRAMPTSRRSWPRCRRASAKRSGASGATRSATTSRSISSRERHLKKSHWDAFFAFYMDTGSRKWGRPYLTRAFFDRDRRDDGRACPARHGAPQRSPYRWRDQFLGDDAIYGRNWGAIEERPFLHFEVCYYQAIEYAIRHGFKRVEAGAQGEHKLARGYRPGRRPIPRMISPTRASTPPCAIISSAKSVAVDEKIADYEAGLPFRKATPPASSRSPTLMTYDPKTSSPRFCAQKCRAQRSTRTTRHSSSWTSCRARPGTRW